MDPAGFLYMKRLQYMDPAGSICINKLQYIDPVGSIYESYSPICG